MTFFFLAQDVSEAIEKNGRTIEGLEELAMRSNQLFHNNMNLWTLGVVLAVLGYGTTKIITRSIKKEMNIKIIREPIAPDYDVNFGKYNDLINLNALRANFQSGKKAESIKCSLNEAQSNKELNQKKKIVLLFEVAATLRYGFGQINIEPHSKMWVYTKDSVREK